MPTTDTPVVFDPFNPDFIANPYPLLHRLRARAPVHHSPWGFWVLTRYADVAHVLRHPQVFGTYVLRDRLRAQLGDGAAFAYVSRRLTSLDPPDHTRLRTLVTKAFTVRRVDAMRPQIQVLADHLLDAVGERRRMDVITALAHPLPSLVICEMLGVPEVDRAQLSAWTGAIAFLFAPTIQPERLVAAEQAAHAFMAYLRALVQARQCALGDDLLSALMAAESEGNHLTEEELVATIIFLFSAGHQTTRDLVGNGLLALLHHPDQWQRLVLRPRNNSRV
jgi:cytochrome P450